MCGKINERKVCNIPGQHQFLFSCKERTQMVSIYCTLMCYRKKLQLQIVQSLNGEIHYRIYDTSKPSLFIPKSVAK